MKYRNMYGLSMVVCVCFCEHFVMTIRLNDVHANCVGKVWRVTARFSECRVL